MWVNADDGVVRGVEVKTGRVKVSLRVCGGGEKVRTLWAGRVDGREVLVTGGFDKGLKVWSVEGEGEGEEGDKEDGGEGESGEGGGVVSVGVEGVGVDGGDGDGGDGGGGDGGGGDGGGGE